MKPNIAEIKELNDFCETWFSVAREWDPLSQDEIDTIQDLVASNKSLIGEVERQAEEIERLKEFVATIVNSYHHVLTFELTQEGIRLVQGEAPQDA